MTGNPFVDDETQGASNPVGGIDHTCADRDPTLTDLPLLHRFPRLMLLGEAPFDHPVIVQALTAVGAQVLSRRALQGGRHTVAEVTACTEQEIRSWRGVGDLTATRILIGLQSLDESAELLRQQIADHEAANRTEATATSTLANQLSRMAEWARFARGAHTWGDVVEAMETRLPPDISSAWDEVRGTVLDDVMTPQPLDLLAGWIGGLDARERGILEGRIVRLRERTLQEIGDIHGVSRERIRQIQRNLEAELNLRLHDSDWRGVGWAVHELRTALGPVTKVV